MKKHFYNSLYFRLIAPFLFGIVVYILILLIFDDISKLSENFFSFEIIICSLISYLNAESLRLNIVLQKKFLPVKFSFSKKILIHFITSTFIIILITSAIVIFHMEVLVGFETYKTELIVFNTLFVLLGSCYSLLYFSIEYAAQMTKVKMQYEEKIKKNIESELEAYKEQINPNLFKKSLEILIGKSYTSADDADEYISQISDFYRSILDNKRSELINLKDELETAKNFIELQNSWYNNNINLQTNIKSEYLQLKLVPGTIHSILDYLINKSIINSLTPLNIEITSNNQSLSINCNKKDQIGKQMEISEDTQHLIETYLYYSEHKPEINDKKNSFLATIPLLQEASNSN